jgi:hypothetical protein
VPVLVLVLVPVQGMARGQMLSVRLRELHTEVPHRSFGVPQGGRRPYRVEGTQLQRPLLLPQQLLLRVHVRARHRREEHLSY